VSGLLSKKSCLTSNYILCSDKVETKWNFKCLQVGMSVSMWEQELDFEEVEQMVGFFIAVTFCLVK
jgi:hypothetical protein